MMAAEPKRSVVNVNANETVAEEVPRVKLANETTDQTIHENIEQCRCLVN